MAPGLSDPEENDMPTMGGRIWYQTPPAVNRGKGTTKPPVRKRRKRS